MKLASFLKIRNQVLLFGIIMSSIPLIFMTTYYLVQVRSDVEQRIEDRQKLLINYFANQIEHELAQATQVVQLLSQVMNIEEQRGLFYKVLKENEFIEEIVILDQGGFIKEKVARYTLNHAGENGDWLDPNIDVVPLKNHVVLSQVQFNLYEQPVLKLLTELQHHEDESIGITLQLQKLVGEISSYQLNEPGYVFLLDSFDHVIAHQDYTQLWQKKHAYLNESDEPMIQQVTTLDEIQWLLVLEQPVQELYAPMVHLVRNSTIVAVFIILFISFISINAGLYFVKPIEILQRAMKKLKNGQLERKISVQRNDEFGELAHSFNDMSQEITEKTTLLLQEKERLNIIVSSIGAGLAVVRSDYKVEWMNDLLKSWVAGDETMPCYKLFNEKEGPCCDCPTIEHSCGRDLNEFLVKKDKSGRKRVFKHRVYPLKHSPNEMKQSLVVIEDVTEQKEMEEALIQTDKLSALGLMASSFAHEVNNPLATIKVYAEDLLDRLDEEELERSELEQYLQVINQNTDRCKKITRNLLNFSRKSEWSIQDVDVNEVIQSSIELVLHSLKKKNVELRSTLNPDLPSVKGDGLNLMQVFVNIMNNSIDAMEEGRKTLTIETYTDKEQNFVTIAISDTGTGIDEVGLSKIFDPFYTTKPVGKGTGLGLSVCYGIVKQLGGTITVESEVGKGTVFFIKLPTQ